MDFFQAQDSARSRTRTLVLLFVLAVLAIIAGIYLVAHLSVGPGPGGAVDPVLLGVVAAATLLLVATGSTVRTVQLRQGGGRVARLLGGRPVPGDTADEAERRLMNVVEEMAIASGMPVPAVFVLDREPGVNAFAAGYTLDDAAVAVTRGALEALSRDELQGVVAHEFAHILNGDMRLNIRIMGLLFGILLLTVVGRGLAHAGGGRRRDGHQLALLGLALIAVGYIGVLFGRMIQAAVSRQREYLADAAAVQFTRNPSGLAGALDRIRAAARGSKLDDHHAQEASHLFFANGLGRPFGSLFATHPPLDERIRRILPRSAPEPAARPGRTEPRPAPVAAAAGATGLVAGGETTGRATGVAPATMLASVGAPRPEHVAYARRLLEDLPFSLHAAAHDPAEAPALLLALLGGDANGRHRAAIETAGEAPGRVDGLARETTALGRHARLPVLELLLPALRELPGDRRARLLDAARTLIDADARVDAFELAAFHVLRRQLAPAADPARDAGRTIRSLRSLSEPVEVLLSALAWSGAAGADEAARAFDEAAAELARQTGPMTLRPRADLDVATLDRALDDVRHAKPALRRRVLEACALVAAHDGRIAPEEAEMLRAVAEAVDCPMPPAF